MSEFEKKQRAEYQRKRKKAISVFLAFILALSLLTAIFSITFLRLDADTFVFFQEEGTAIYHAYLSDNEYYEEERLNGQHAYVSSLIDHMDAEFCYKLQTETDDVTYKYQHRVDLQLVVMDTNSGAAIYNPTETVLGPTDNTFSGPLLKVNPKIDIDYKKYDNIAKAFIKEYNLKDVSAHLNVTMYVDVVGMSESFSSDNESQYTIQVKIPLNQLTIKPQTTSTVPAGPQKILANPNEQKAVFKLLAIILGALDASLIAATFIYTVKTRDEHIDYSRKVQKLLSNYRSFIQKINSPFDTTGYQLLAVDTFTEMLEIRDTLQRPILMFENEDKTRSTFMITADTRLLYVFDVKVDNYDQLYSTEKK